MTPEERRALEHRASSLRPHLAPHAPSQIDAAATAVSEMFGGFPSLRGVLDTEVAAKVKLTMSAVAEFPLWAIEAGCASIRIRGYQTVDGQGVARTERHWAPSDGEVHKAVADLARPRAEALRSAEALLAAEVDAEELAASTARKAEQVAEWEARKANMIGPAELEGALAAAKGRQAERSATRTESVIRAGYAAAGVDVPEGALVSLSMRKAMGWTIEEVGGRNMLVAPPAPKALTSCPRCHRDLTEGLDVALCRREDCFQRATEPTSALRGEK